MSKATPSAKAIEAARQMVIAYYGPWAAKITTERALPMAWAMLSHLSVRPDEREAISDRERRIAVLQAVIVLEQAGA
jgi:hypothetical protein